MRKDNTLWISVFCLLAFFLVVINLNSAFFLKFDSAVSNFVVYHQNFTLNKICSVISVIFEPTYVIIFVFILSAILWIKKFKNEALFLVFVSATSGVLIYLLKNLFARPRPVLEFLQETGYSFPSGHALISVALFGSLFYFLLRVKSDWKRISLILFSCLGILILGLSRVYLNVHWVSDILGGYFLGATILFVGIYILKQGK